MRGSRKRIREALDPVPGGGCPRRVQGSGMRPGTCISASWRRAPNRRSAYASGRTGCAAGHVAGSAPTDLVREQVALILSLDVDLTGFENLVLLIGDVLVLASARRDRCAHRTRPGGLSGT